MYTKRDFSPIRISLRPCGYSKCSVTLPPADAAVVRLVVFGYRSAAVTYSGAIDLSKRSANSSISSIEKHEKLFHHLLGFGTVNIISKTITKAN